MLNVDARKPEIDLLCGEFTPETAMHRDLMQQKLTNAPVRAGFGVNR
jgi:hypothetical protein